MEKQKIVTYVPQKQKKCTKCEREKNNYRHLREFRKKKKKKISNRLILVGDLNCSEVRWET